MVLAVCLTSASLTTLGGPARIIKVLPHHLDQAGRASRSPSLYERDAYQAHLRRNPSLCSGLRFDVQWKAKPAAAAQLKLRLELLTSTRPKHQPLVLEKPLVAKTRWARWSALSLTGEAFRQAGDIIAWRASLWDGERLLAEQRSFLW
jgi:hypothetical protein